MPKSRSEDARALVGHGGFVDADVDPSWPKTGTLRGEKIDLAEAVRTLPRDELSIVIVDVPGVGPSQPWKQSDFYITEDGRIVL